MKRKNAKLSVDSDYRLDPLSENEKGWLAVLDIDVTDAECTSYLEEFLENRTRGTSSLGRYVFGSEISYNKPPPRLPGLGC